MEVSLNVFANAGEQHGRSRNQLIFVVICLLFQFVIDRFELFLDLNYFRPIAVILLLLYCCLNGWE